jgi:hypothetical protein
MPGRLIEVQSRRKKTDQPDQSRPDAGGDQDVVDVEAVLLIERPLVCFLGHLSSLGQASQTFSEAVHTFGRFSLAIKSSVTGNSG